MAWTGLLRATGGALELTKCSYHIMYWKFIPNGAPVLTNVSDEVPPIMVRDPHTDTLKVLYHLSPYTAHETLGHYKEPAGSQFKQCTQLTQKSDLITEFLWKTPLTQAEAWTYYTACYVPAICYPLTCSHMTRLQLEQVQQKAKSIIIPRCSFNRKMHRAIIYGLHGLVCANFRHLHVKQGAQQVTYFLWQWRVQTVVGKLFRCVLAWIQVSVGVSYPVLEQPATELPHMEAIWVSSMRQFLSQTSTTIQLDDPGVPPRQRVSDEYLMDLILATNHYTPADIRKLNYCRLFIDAITVSDLSMPCVTRLDMDKAMGRPQTTSSISHPLAIHQTSPSPVEWRLWQRALLIWSDINGRLRKPLGKWVIPLDRQRQRHHAYVYQHCLWVRRSKETDEYSEYQRYAADEGFHSMNKNTPFQSIPRSALPTSPFRDDEDDVWTLQNQPQVEHQFSQPTAAHPRATTFQEYSATLPLWEAELFC